MGMLLGMVENMYSQLFLYFFITNYFLHFYQRPFNKLLGLTEIVRVEALRGYLYLNILLLHAYIFII